MKRIKQIIESFLNIGRDPVAEISSAWARVASGSSSTNAGDLALIDRIVAVAMQQAEEMKRKGETATTANEVKS